jgi:anaerobic sulfite reductase subunit A
MGYSISKENFNEFLAEFSKQYKIYAPKRYEKRGRFSDTATVVLVTSAQSTRSLIASL